MEDEEIIREAMKRLGQRTSTKKAQSSSANVAKAREARNTPEVRQKMSAGQQRRRERERAEKVQES